MPTSAAMLEGWIAVLNRFGFRARVHGLGANSLNRPAKADTVASAVLKSGVSL
jgi:hypothetical protein